MSNFETREGKATLFTNNFKKADNHPDFKGKVKIKGIEYDIALWNGKPDKNGKDTKSISISENTWKPENKKSDLNASDASTFQNNKEVPEDDLPF